MNDFKKSRSFGDRGGFGARRSYHDADKPESHKATCSSCNMLCEVPFRPNGKKPVYCRNCFKANVPTISFTGQPFRSEEKEGGDDLKKQFAVLNTKLDKLIAVIEAQTRAITGSKS